MCRALTATLILLALGAPGRAEDRPALANALALEEAFQAAIKKAEPSVVCIWVSRAEPRTAPRPSDPDAVPEAFGSGVVLGAQEGHGLVLTNYHVVRDSTVLDVCLPGGKTSRATILASDPRSDLAVLKLEEAWPVQAMKLGDGDAVRKGQFVLSIANPFAVGFRDGSPSASWGIVSNLRRRAPGKPPLRERDPARTTLHHYGTLIQTDARLNLGCSGGALVNLKGEMIGLLTAQAALSGGESAGGFAVPMNGRMKQIVRRLLEGREVEYGFLGVQFQPPRGYPPGALKGVPVRVLKGSPIAQALARPYGGEVVIDRVDDIPVRSPDDLLYAVGSLLAGTEVKLEINGSPKPRTVKLAKYFVPGPIIAANRPPPVHGLRVDYTSVLFQRANWGDEIPRGVYVAEVAPGSKAEEAKLKDTVITQVNGQAVATPAEFYRAAAQKPGPLHLLLNDGTKVTLD